MILMMNTLKKIPTQTLTVDDLPIRKGVIIGSYALGTRYAKDIDVVCMSEDILCEHNQKDAYQCSFNFMGRRVECLLANQQPSFKYLLASYDDGISIASIGELFAIKAGHIIYPHRAWDKHITDYHILYSMLTNPPNESLIKLHRQSTKERLGRGKTPRLVGVSREEFFDDNVVKYYVHDNIHRAISHTPGMSTYSKMQRNPESVECSEDLWVKLSEQEKMWCVLEEAYVIALERHIIPLNKGVAKVVLSPFEAFKWALMRICTTLCSGWFRDHAINNYFTILNAWDPGYIDRFEANIGKYEYIS